MLDFESAKLLINSYTAKYNFNKLRKPHRRWRVLCRLPWGRLVEVLVFRRVAEVDFVFKILLGSYQSGLG